MEAGTFVLLTYPDILGGWHQVGRVVAEAHPDGIAPPDVDIFWIDYNGGGVHLPQMYRADDIRPLTDDDLDVHALCPGCKGFGLDPEVPAATTIQEIMGDRPPCPECGGSGRTIIRVDVLRGQGESRIDAVLDTEAAEAVPCPACRAAFTPQVRRA